MSADSLRRQQHQQQQRWPTWWPEDYRGTSRFYMIIYSLIGLTALVVSIIKDLDVTYFGVVGGCFGVICSSVVLWSSFFLKANQKTSSTYLLFWRSVCDFGIGVRFLTGIQWNYWQCGAEFCTLAQHQDCSAPAFLLEFFELASEAWFFCVAMDLAVSVTDPFSSPKARLNMYHAISWSFGLVMALAVSLDKKINGLWWITEEVSDHGFCWIQNHTQASSVNYKPFVFFYIPLLVVYGYSSYVMVSAYNRLRLGISKTFQHRVQMLTTNAVNVTVYFLYWTVVLIMYALVNDLSFSHPTVAKWLFNVLIFTLSAKGFADLVVHLIVLDVKTQGSAAIKAAEEEDGTDAAGVQDFNAALRAEVLHFATTGIRVCAQRAVKSTEGKRKVVLSMAQNDIASNNDNNVQLSPYFFLQLMFGSHSKLDELKAVMIRDSSTAVSVRTTAHVNAVSSSAAADSSTATGVGRGSSPGPATASCSSRPVSTRIAVLSDGGGLLETTVLDDGYQDGGGVLNPVHAAVNGAGAYGGNTGGGGGCMLDLEGGGGGTGVMRKTNSSERETYAVGRAFTQNSTDEFRFTEMSERVSSGSFTKQQQQEQQQNDSEGSVHSINSTASGNSAAGQARGTHVGGTSGGSASGNAGGFGSRFSDFCCNALQLLCCGSPESSKDAAEVKFTEYEPFYFRLIRQCSGVDDDVYKTAFKNTIKERLTEGGASGAFFFFSKGERFIAKSCTELEMEVLTSNAGKYANYLAANRESFITRIYGAYKLHIYGTDLNFFVMNNLFLTPNNEIINEKYDLKGSWVSRNATPPQEGQRVPCTYCNQTYVYHRSKPKSTKSKRNNKDSMGGKTLSTNKSFSELAGIGSGSPVAAGGVSDMVDPVQQQQQQQQQQPAEHDASKCPFTVLGYHEPNIILKDNDLKHKMRLPQKMSKRILMQLKSDAHFLCSLGVMDYSLLVGVHNTEYAVEEQVHVEISTGQMDEKDDKNLVDGNSDAENNSELSQSDISEAMDTGRVTSTADRVSTSARMSMGSNSALRRRNSVLSVVPPGDMIPSPRHRSTALTKEDGPITGRLEVSRVVGPKAYYLGIVDYQQKWDLNKQLERIGKINFKGADPAGLSSIEPEQYRDRFVSRMEELLDADEWRFDSHQNLEQQLSGGTLSAMGSRQTSHNSVESADFIQQAQAEPHTQTQTQTQTQLRWSQSLSPRHQNNKQPQQKEMVRDSGLYSVGSNSGNNGGSSSNSGSICSQPPHAKNNNNNNNSTDNNKVWSSGKEPITGSL